MIRVLLTAAALPVLALAACSDVPIDDAKAGDMPALSATHAFETNGRIKAIAFSPNDVASWLGAIAYITEKGNLYTTGIEGEDAKFLSGGPYIDIIGTNRKAAPALFLALTETGQIRPFLEADSEGNFKAIPMSGNATAGDKNAPAMFCKTADGISESLTYITKSGDIMRADLTLGDSAVLRAGEIVGKVKKAQNCAVYGGETYTLGNGKLSVSGGGSVKADGTGLAVLDTGAQAYLAVSAQSGQTLSLFTAGDLSTAGAFAVESGLSIQGLSGAKGVFATAAPYGGSGFNDGIIALADSDAPRTVILSGSYLGRELSGLD